MLTRHMTESPVAGARSLFIGVRAAVRSPLWVEGDRFRSALEADVDETISASVDPDLVLALKIANGAIRHLSRTRTAWKNTCLYRSMAQYLVLRDFGKSAAIRVGVQGPESEARIKAHSWVIYHGPEPVEDGGESFEELRFQH
jgi:hypothetical protein